MKEKLSSRNNFLNFLRSIKIKQRESIFIILFIFLVITIHSILARYHFHEADSALVYEKLTKNVLSIKGSMESNVLVTTPSFLIPFRKAIVSASEYITFQPLRSSIILSLTTTYPLIEGLFYGLYIPNTFREFYNFSAFINILILIISCLLIYKSLILLGVNKFISFTFSFILINFYSINSYSYHLGSTIWHVFSSCICIYCVVFSKYKRAKLIYPIALIAGYPSIFFFLSNFLYKLKLNYEINKKSLNKSKLTLVFSTFYCDYKYSVLTSFVLICLFLPFHSSYRARPDWRGIFTPFSFSPLPNSINFITYLFTLALIILCLKAYFSNYFKKGLFNQKDINSKKASEIMQIILINFFIFFLLLVNKRFTFATTRHSLFLVPFITFVSGIGLQCFVVESISNIPKIKKVINSFLILLFSFSFVLSINSSIYRIDPLKKDAIPKRIREFQSKNLENTITLLGSDIHYLYNDFTEEFATYSKTEPYKNLSFTEPGTRLIVAQQNGSFKPYIINAEEELSKGDKLVAQNIRKNFIYNNIDITLVEDPYIIKNDIFFDSLNFNPKNKFSQRNNAYSRPNNIYIFPVTITKKSLKNQRIISIN